MRALGANWIRQVTVFPTRQNSGAPGTLLDSSTDCVKVIGLDGTLQGMNPEGICLMEIDDFTAVRGTAWSSIWPDRHRLMLEAAVARAAAGSVARFSADCPTAKGTPKHWDVVVSPVHNDLGELISLLSISRDVTREVHVAGERALVTRELAHRIANLFTVINGVISLSARGNPVGKVFVETLRDRIAGLGRAVSYVYGDSVADNAAQQGQSFHGLLGELLNPYASGSAEAVTITGDDHPLSSQAITPLALIVNELATNALKYGALAHPDGKVAIATSRQDQTYRIDWWETGLVGLTEPRSNGFGTVLLDRSVGLQLGATITRDWRPEGLGVRILIPVSKL